MPTDHARSLDKWITRAVIIAIPVIITIGLFFYEIESRVDAINQSRAETTYAGCLEQNEENRNALRVVRKIFDDSVKAGEQTKAEADTGFAVTATVIDALAPVRDCAALVQQRFGYVPQGEEADQL